MVTPSVEQLERSRVFPKLSFGRLAILFTGSIFLGWLCRLAFLGWVLPRVILLALGCLLLFHFLSILLFLVAWIPAFVVQASTDETRKGNPFAADQLPPQILPPSRDT